MLACGCGACHCILPVVCLHCSLFNVGSLVCVSQLPSLLIRASPLNMTACHNACRVVIFFYPKCPWVSGWWGNAAMLSLPKACSNQSLWQREKQRRRGSEGAENVLTGGEDRDSFGLLNPSITTQWPTAEHMPTASQCETDHTHRPVSSHWPDVSVTIEMD